ncbi:prephenate dehydrogenase [Lacisediminihabitans profunda]|uniref:Prephenate dehydrogenase n=1 Tax=Lacisediminihabitans profunda TaxID=2594790 RepID=A0A5C8UIJ5_9MICO|nr:prephenate dehydrogenase [Lacisediminihabitans profunda]TXN27948.1 prephenate dehydrogenase [Lacisediminihabitans profunda]
MVDVNSRIVGEVRVVGAGLLGASVGLGLRAKGVDVIVHDASPANLRLAIDYGAGRAARDTDNPTLIVVAVPPDVTAAVIAAELTAFPDALVTDVASVKAAPLAELLATGADVARYIGSHPLAGRERGGAISARADLFIGRPWVITPHGPARFGEVGVIEDLVLDLGAVPVTMTAEQHDSSVALVSHVPQVIASLLAARLNSAPESALSLAGQGLRDTTRIASSDPELWVQILGANSAEVVRILHAYREDLDAIVAALEAPDVAGARRAVAESLAAGNSGVSRIPGKHGQDRRFGQLVVMVDDKPGELARLLTEIGEAGVNMEDLRLEHSPGAQIGLAEISVLTEVEERLAAELEAGGWKIAGAWK